MRQIPRFPMFIFVSSISLIMHAHHGMASEWGCEVLLCAASSNPSWRGVPACHPPMTKLIAAMRRPGFSWPTCPEGGTDVPGYEQYGECPADFRVGYSNRGDSGINRDPDLCVKTIDTCNDGFNHFGRESDRQCIQTITLPRPHRQEPYFFDIKNDTSGQSERHWFELNR